MTQTFRPETIICSTRQALPSLWQVKLSLALIGDATCWYPAISPDSREPMNRLCRVDTYPHDFPSTSLALEHIVESGAVFPSSVCATIAVRLPLGPRLLSGPYRPVICTTPKVDFSGADSTTPVATAIESHLWRTSWKPSQPSLEPTYGLGPTSILNCSSFVIVRRLHGDSIRFTIYWPLEGRGMANP